VASRPPRSTPAAITPLEPQDARILKHGRRLAPEPKSPIMNKSVSTASTRSTVEPPQRPAVKPV